MVQRMPQAEFLMLPVVDLPTAKPEDFAKDRYDALLAHSDQIAQEYTLCTTSNNICCG